MALIVNFFRRCAFITMALGCLYGQVMAEEAQPVDRIVAVVNDGVILRSELDAFYQNVKRDPSASRVSERQALDTLIVRKIQLDTAREQNIYISDFQIEEYIRGFLSANELTRESHARRLRARGRSYADWRAEVRELLLINELQQQQLRSYARIDPAEVDNELVANPPPFLLQARYNLIHLVLSDEQISEAEIKRLVTSVEAMESFADLSAWGKTLAYEDLQLNNFNDRRLGQLPNRLVKEVMFMQPGETRVLRDEDLIQIFKALAVQYPQTALQTEYRLMSLSLLTNVIYTKEQLEVQIRDIHARLVAGENFNELAATYGDRNAPFTDYELEWVGREILPIDLVARLDKLLVGDFSAPFYVDDGWHLVLLADKRERDATLDRIRLQVQEQLVRRKLQLTLPFWLNDIRSRAHIEYRLAEESL